MTPSRAALALVVANVRYWLTVAPLVRRELCRWELRARAIPDPTLRAHALAKLADAGAHAQVTATLATLAPLRRRARAIVAMVAFEVIYDYLDAVSEQPVADPLRNGRQLYRALRLALARDAQTPDYYRYHPQRDDSAYLDALVATCRAAFWTLPAALSVAPVAQWTAAWCGEAQTRSHAVSHAGAGQLERWARNHLSESELTWWEAAAGAAASVLTVHALIAAAADRRTSATDAHRIATAYLPLCTLTTMLDSLVDRVRDAASGAHSYLAYYADDRIAAERLSAVARQALARAATLRHAPHHAMTVVGVAAYYLSTPEVRGERASLPAGRVARDLRPSITPVLLLFRLWRWLRQRSAAPRSARNRHRRTAVTGRSPSAPVLRD